MAPDGGEIAFLEIQLRPMGKQPRRRGSRSRRFREGVLRGIPGSQARQDPAFQEGHESVPGIQVQNLLGRGKGLFEMVPGNLRVRQFLIGGLPMEEASRRKAAFRPGPVPASRRPRWAAARAAWESRSIRSNAA